MQAFLSKPISLWTKGFNKTFGKYFSERAHGKVSNLVKLIWIYFFSSNFTRIFFRIVCCVHLARKQLIRKQAWTNHHVHYLFLWKYISLEMKFNGEKEREREREREKEREKNIVFFFSKLWLSIVTIIIIGMMISLSLSLSFSPMLLTKCWVWIENFANTKIYLEENKTGGKWKRMEFAHSSDVTITTEAAAAARRQNSIFHTVINDYDEGEWLQWWNMKSLIQFKRLIKAHFIVERRSWGRTLNVF